MQYVILRVALHEVLIVIALGHVEASVKSFRKKRKNKFLNNNFKTISNEKNIKKRKFKILFHFKTKNI